MTRRTPVAIALVVAAAALAAGSTSPATGARAEANGRAGAARASQQAASAPRIVWSPATFVISGHGWGHGVGLSQYGALGFAQHGYSYDQIVSHYYPGTDIQPGASATVRVLLAGGRASLKISSETPFTVTDASGTSYEPADLFVELDSTLSVNTADGQTGVALTAPLVFRAGSSPLIYGGRAYRGTFRVLLNAEKLRLVNHVSLEPYLYGVVPSESPHDWPAAALQAQAVVARSYALASLNKPTADFDVYADVRSQVYLGRAHEYPETTAAVQSTAGQAVYYQGEIAHTFFFSTSGGRTAAIQDVWPKADPEPYLVSVPDPYDDTSPYHNWGPFTYQSKKLAKKLNTGAVSDLSAKSNKSKRVSTVTLTAANGSTTEVTGEQLKDALGLRSSWFRAKVFAIQRPKTAVPWGTKVRIKGRARGAKAVTLESRLQGGTWKSGRRLAVRQGGAFSLVLRPRTTTYYRIVEGEATGSVVRFPVAPRVRLSSIDPGLFRGTVRPADPGASVQLQRLGSGVWKVVASLDLDETGAFVWTGPLPPARYRVRVVGITGLSPGFSPIADLSL